MSSQTAVTDKGTGLDAMELTNLYISLYHIEGMRSAELAELAASKLRDLLTASAVDSEEDEN